MCRTEEVIENWTVLGPRQFMSNALRWLPQLQAGDVVRVPLRRMRPSTRPHQRLRRPGRRGHLLTGNAACSIRAYSAGSELAGVGLAARWDRS
jgi:hypothetical protein